MDLTVFAIGVCAGALAIFVPWVQPAFRRYVLNCGKLSHQCPHHGPDNDKRLDDSNHKTRNGPTRPDIR